MASPSISPRLLHVDKQGRVVIPADLREALRLEPGGNLIAFVEAGQLVLRPRQMAESELWSMFSSVENSLSRELIEERRAEAEREN